MARRARGYVAVSAVAAVDVNLHALAQTLDEREGNYIHSGVASIAGDGGLLVAFHRAFRVAELAFLDESKAVAVRSPN
jgi:hypothetical protein